MKKELIYFIAGAGLMAAIMSFYGKEYSSYEECRMLELRKMPDASAHYVVTKFCKKKFKEELEEERQERDERIKELLKKQKQ
tara:strand:- start:495 stop:740 length:246 start_codon:yes stop_codon:yes gene_type:complete